MAINSVHSVNAPVLDEQTAATKIQALYRGRLVINHQPGLKLKYPTCGFCMEDFTPIDKVARFSCSAKHILHIDCAKRLADHNQNDCPFDRTPDANPYRTRRVINEVARQLERRFQLRRADLSIVALLFITELGSNIALGTVAALHRFASLSNPLQKNPDIAGVVTAVLAGAAVMGAVHTITSRVNAHLNQIIEQDPNWEDPVDFIAVPLIRVAIVVGAIATISFFGLGE